MSGEFGIISPTSFLLLVLLKPFSLPFTSLTGLHSRSPWVSLTLPLVIPQQLSTSPGSPPWEDAPRILPGSACRQRSFCSARLFLVSVAACQDAAHVHAWQNSRSVFVRELRVCTQAVRPMYSLGRGMCAPQFVCASLCGL